VTREKGLRPQLVVYRKHGGDAERLGAGAGVKAGDLLQLAYVSAGRRFGVIASVDARGTVTPHLPALPGAATALAAHGETRLAHSYELDASPGFERFVFVTADEPFATEVVTRALQSGAAPLPPAFAIVEITLRKETP
jgi:hypothetical protein